MSRAKILLVDDNSIVRGVLCDALKDSSFQVVDAIGYADAVELFDHTIDLALVDIVLEGKSGLDILAYIRKQQPLCPVIMISAYANKTNAMDALHRGAADYLEKPINVGELLHVIERCLSYNTMQQENMRLQQEQKLQYALNEQRRSLQTILNHAPVGIWRLGTDNRIDFINPAFCNAVGVEEQRFLQAEHYAQLLPEDVARSCMASDKSCFDSKAQVSSIEEIPCLDGKLSSFEIIKAPILNDQGIVQGLVGLATDITENRQTEKALQQQVHKLKRFNTMSVGRELRMIELKEEVNALLNQQGREAKYIIHPIEADDNSKAAP